jgi:hypothetical protein
MVRRGAKPIAAGRAISMVISEMKSLGEECTSRELLPPNFQKLERDEVTRRIRELKVMLEER